MCDLLETATTTAKILTTLKPQTTRKPDTTTVESHTMKQSSDKSPSNEQDSNSHHVLVFIVFAIIIVLVCWVSYAYTHPYTSSGQLLIKYSRLDGNSV
jgi:hypothetical protein